MGGANRAEWHKVSIHIPDFLFSIQYVMELRRLIIETLSHMYHMREFWGKVLIAQNNLGNGYTTNETQSSAMFARPSALRAPT